MRSARSTKLAWGRGSVLPFEGAAGMGRSSVLTALREIDLQRGMEVLTAKGGRIGAVQSRERRLHAPVVGGSLGDTMARRQLQAHRGRNESVRRRA